MGQAQDEVPIGNNIALGNTQDQHKKTMRPENNDSMAWRMLCSLLILSNEPRAFEVSWFFFRYQNVPYAPSGDVAIETNGYAPPVLSRQDGGVFSFQNLSFTLWDQHPEYQGTLTATGYLNGAEVGSASVHSAGNQWVSLSANFDAVDKVAFKIDGDFIQGPYKYSFVLDNINVSAVPEPSSYAMLLAGLLILLVIWPAQLGSNQRPSA